MSPSQEIDGERIVPTLLLFVSFCAFLWLFLPLSGMSLEGCRRLGAVMRVSVYWFGRPARSPYETQVEDFRRRVSRRWPAEDIALKPANSLREADPRAALVREAETVLARIPPRWQLVVLDEHGRSRTSTNFAHFLQVTERQAPPGVAFVLGSDLGVASSLRDQADVVLSLSPMTLPHLLARLMVWEQLYRATDILGPGNYHRAGIS